MVMRPQTDPSKVFLHSRISMFHYPLSLVVVTPRSLVGADLK